MYFHSGSQATYRKVTKVAKGEFTSIPEIDISNIDSPSLEERKKIAKEIYDACSVSGFFYLINHGIPEEVLNQTFKIMKRFFELDHDTKMDAHVQKNPAIRGYEPPLETRNDPRTKGGRHLCHTCAEKTMSLTSSRLQRSVYHGRLRD